MSQDSWVGDSTKIACLPRAWTTADVIGCLFLFYSVTTSQRLSLSQGLNLCSGVWRAEFLVFHILKSCVRVFMYALLCTGQHSDSDWLGVGLSLHTTGSGFVALTHRSSKCCHDSRCQNLKLWYSASILCFASGLFSDRTIKTDLKWTEVLNQHIFFYSFGIRSYQMYS